MSREKRNARVWANYDNWKLASPPEYDYPEVFETDIYLEQSWFSCDEDLIEEFNTRAIECEKTWKNNYDSYEESIYDLVDDLNLAYSDEQALIDAAENERDEYEAAMEAKFEAKRNGDY